MTTKEKAEAFIQRHLPNFRARVVERHNRISLALDPLMGVEWQVLTDIIILAYLEGDMDGYVTGHHAIADSLQEILGGHVEPIQ
jgi:hypothetical protein